MKHRSLIGTIALLALLLAGCQAGSEEAPTLTSEDVLGTAQAIAQLTRSAPTATATVPPQTATPSVPPPTPVPSETPTPDFPAVTATYTVSVRSGPGEEYPAIDLFLQGQTAQIVGRFDDTPIGTWFLVTRIGAGIDGWVWSGAADQSGDLSGIPVLEAPPIPDD